MIKKHDKRGRPFEEFLREKLRVPQTAGAYIAAHVERDPEETEEEHLKFLRGALHNIAEAHGMSLKTNEEPHDP